MELKHDEWKRLEREMETQGRDPGRQPMTAKDLGWALLATLFAWALVLGLVHALGWVTDALRAAGWL